jgi:predicted ATP-dependent endonuclease of OLD family
MRITKIHIENYRSIMDLTFEPGPYCVLIGENNAGKSNILRALNLVLGEMWPSERSFTEEDFFNQDTSRDIVIQVYFDEAWEEWRNAHSMRVQGFQLACHALKRKSGKKQRGDITVTYTCITHTGSPCQYPAEPKKYKGTWVPLRVTREARDRLPIIYVGVLREYDRQTPSSRWSVLRKIFNDVNTQFMNDTTKVDVRMPDGTTAKMTRKEAFGYCVNEAYRYLYTATFQDIEQRLVANTMEQMGLDPSEGQVKLHFETHDPAHAYKNLQLYVDQMGTTTPAGDVGAGLQSAIVVGIFRTYEELRKEGGVFAIEEPEVFLHPQKARYFETVLESLTRGGNQIFVTTHSPIFVRIYHPESVAVVRRTEERGTWVAQTQRVDLAENDRKALRLMTEFDTQRNELFFARKVMLVEGATEKVAVPLAFKALGMDPNRLGISIVECGGKTKLPLFIKVLSALDIPYVVLADHDVKEIEPEWTNGRKAEELARNEKHESWNRQIEAVCDEGCLFWLRPNFEVELGLPESESEKIDQALAQFEDSKASEIPDCIKAPINALLEKGT